MLSCAGVAAVCYGLGTLAGRHWPRPEPGIILTTRAQEAERPDIPASLAAREPQEREPEKRESQEREPEASAVALAAPPVPWAPQETREELPGEIQRVTGADSPDAGASAAPTADAGLDAAARAPLKPEGPQPPRPEDNTAALPPPGESCGIVICPAGYGCCNPSCGVCVAPGDNCDPTPCESRIQYPVSLLCGRSTCSVGQVCCNPSCGICVAPGETCDQALCDNAIQYPFSPSCGRVTCSVGEECCNPSCGICVSPGESCSQQLCN